MMELEKLDFAGPIDGIEAFSTTRGNVDGRNAYSGVNLCDYVGDDALRVLDARISLGMQLGIDLDDLVMPRQTHSCRVAVIDERFRSMDIDKQEAALEGVDALVTHLKGVVIGVNTADCVPIVLVDAAAGVIAVAHAGWRGTVGRIAHAVVKEMCRQGAVATRIQAAMGPSICQECFEVGDEVVEAFGKAHFDLGAIVKRNATTGKAHIDLRAANRAVLVSAGVPAGKFEKRLPDMLVKGPVFGLESVVLPRGGASLPRPGEAGLHRKIQQKSEIGFAESRGEGVEACDEFPVNVPGAALIGGGGVVVAVAEHRFAPFQSGQDHLAGVLAPGGFHEEQFRFAVEFFPAPVCLEDGPELFRQGRPPGLPRGDDRDVPGAQEGRAQLELGALPGPFGPLEGDEFAACHI